MGLKQISRAWYGRLDSHLLSLGFERSMNEVTLYVKHASKHKLIVSVYVDDLLITSDKEQLVEEFKANMKDKFEMNELGLQTYFYRHEGNSICTWLFPMSKEVLFEAII